MKNRIFFLLIIFITLSCSKKDDKQERNPYLSDPVVSLNLNLNLPEYNPLKFPGNSVITSQGIKGIVVICISDTQYFAYDLTDPNHAPSNCSRMEINGPIASCPCQNDDNEYNIINFGRHTTEPDTKYPMQSYRAERNGNNIVISN
ncbi:hypothetical protein [Aequorivita antarctica]|uniref:Rieske domain-containing protein n=1 Tax=Aequorivita antarctica TaxID=153266 RepID=A0A5C6Z3B2_9FLAO|nr:hypothetical protein [Aequorivita antarctica]TXD73983.1 hypothetical protein ESU54_05790 [Aequorivita antarctica]SRX73297.1 hypothetical protein AEQU3_00732 [Aequorivita antarctica]